jgi:tetratricopeptide (TPR) repeat protein
MTIASVLRARSHSRRTALAVTLILAGCSARPPESLEVETTSRPPADAEEHEAAPGPSRPELREEAIEPRRGAVGAPRGDLPPSNSLNSGAPPQVVAATRLAEEGHGRMEAGDAEGALDLLERAVALDPNNVFAYQYLAEAYLDLERYDQALTFADRAAALGATVPPVWRSRTYALQGQILETAGNFDRARGAYRKALATDPSNDDARAGLERLGDASP